DETVELIKRPSALPQDAPREVPRAEVERQRAPRVNARAEGADGRDRFRGEDGRGGNENNGRPEPVQRLQVVGDVRINDALDIEVCEQKEGATTGRRPRRKLQVAFT